MRVRQESPALSRRKFLAVAGLGAATGALQAACGGAAATPSGAGAPSGAPQTVRMGLWQADYKPFWDQIFPKFTEKTNIKVEVEIYPSGAAWAEKMIALFVSDSAPDAAHSVSQTDTRFYDSGNI